MQLGNRFKDIDKQRMWIDHPYCANCGSNQNCSIHHILGCKNDEDSSILNSIMFCHKCHKYADAHNVSDIEFQSKWLIYTIKRAIAIEYPLQHNDIVFYKLNERYYNYTNEH